MSNQPNANCLVCGKAYHVCRDCKNANSWRYATCSPAHFQIRAIYLNYRDGLIDLDRARAQMNRVEHSDWHDFKSGYQKFFELLYPTVVNEGLEPVVEGVEIDTLELPVEKPKKKRTKKIVEPISEA